jgi:hypothetical protein
MANNAAITGLVSISGCGVPRPVAIVAGVLIRDVSPGVAVLYPKRMGRLLYLRGDFRMLVGCWVGARRGVDVCRLLLFDSCACATLGDSGRTCCTFTTGLGPTTSILHIDVLVQCNACFKICTTTDLTPRALISCLLATFVEVHPLHP